MQANRARCFCLCFYGGFLYCFKVTDFSDWAPKQNLNTLHRSGLWQFSRKSRSTANRRFICSPSERELCVYLTTFYWMKKIHLFSVSLSPHTAPKPRSDDQRSWMFSRAGRVNLFTDIRRYSSLSFLSYEYLSVLFYFGTESATTLLLFYFLLVWLHQQSLLFFFSFVVSVIVFSITLITIKREEEQLFSSFIIIFIPPMFKHHILIKGINLFSISFNRHTALKPCSPGLVELTCKPIYRRLSFLTWEFLSVLLYFFTVIESAITLFLFFLIFIPVIFGASSHRSP